MKRVRVSSMYYLDINSVLIIDEEDNFYIYREKNKGIFYKRYMNYDKEDCAKFFIQDRYIVILSHKGNYVRYSSWYLKLNVVRNRTQYLQLII